MKLRNKTTGEIGNLKPYEEDGRIWVWIGNMSKPEYRYNSLAELNAEWCDYEEDELLYVISAEHKSGYQCVLKDDYPEICKVAKELGIGFETEKECRIAVNKLKAMAKLKEFGFRFIDWELDMKTVADGKIWFDVGVNTEWDAERLLKLKPEVKESLDLLFGGEE